MCRVSPEGVRSKLGLVLGALRSNFFGWGVSKAQGVDLSPEMVASARDMASRMGYSAKSTFEVGDGAEVGRAYRRDVSCALISFLMIEGRRSYGWGARGENRLLPLMSLAFSTSQLS